MKKAVITGGAGFLGHHLVRILLSHQWQVCVVDDFSTGRRAHLEEFLHSDRFTLLETDITNVEFAGALREYGPDVIFHLAAIHFIPYCIQNPEKTTLVNVIGTQRVLDAFEKSGASRFILASTGDVYANAEQDFRETDPLYGANIYGLSKILDEYLADIVRLRRPDRRVFIARFFNIYGPGETNPHVLPDIMNELTRSHTLRLGNMDSIRDYVYVTDVAEALVRIAGYEGTHFKFNVGTGEGRSVRDLLGVIATLIDGNLTVETDAAKLRTVDRPRLVADTGLIRQELGWVPAMSLKEGLHRTLSASGVKLK